MLSDMEEECIFIKSEKRKQLVKIYEMSPNWHLHWLEGDQEWNYEVPDQTQRNLQESQEHA